MFNARGRVSVSDSSPQKERQKTGGLPVSLHVLLVLVSLAMILAATAGFIVRNNEHALLHDVMREEHRKKFELLILSARGDLVRQKIQRLPERIRELADRDPGLQSVRITGPTGRKLASWRRRGPTGAERPITFAFKVVGNGKTIAHIAAAWDASPSSGMLAEHSNRSLLALGIACLLFALLAFTILEFSTLRPIRSIAQKFRNCRRGNFATRPQVPDFAAAEIKDLEQSGWALSEIFSTRDQTQAELVATREIARNATSARDDFLANMSHELRTPLNAINGFSEMLSGEVLGPMGNREYVEYAKNIKDAGNQLLGLINDVLDLSRFQAGNAALHLEPVNVEQAIQSAIDMVEGFAEMNGLQVERDIAPDLPLLQADPVRLNQILQNLLSNAIKFTRPGGVIRITATRPPSKDLVVTVSDTGIGIQPDKLGHILEPFAHIEDPMTRENRGSGLGLALAKAFIELHGGVLQITSQPDVGTKVTFTLPTPRSGPGGTDLVPGPSSIPSVTAGAY